MKRLGRAFKAFLLTLLRNEVYSEPTTETVRIEVQADEAHAALGRLRLKVSATRAEILNAGRALHEFNAELERTQFRNGPHCN